MRGSDGVPECVGLIAFGNKAGNGTELWLFTALDVNGVVAQKRPELEAQLQATLNVIPAYRTNSNGGATSDLATAHPISQLLGLSIGLVKKMHPALVAGLGKAGLATRYEMCAPTLRHPGS
jgi:hypothetical protein